jgi:hypothetical protein
VSRIMTAPQYRPFVAAGAEFGGQHQAAELMKSATGQSG